MYFSVHLCIFLWISVNFCNFVYFSVRYCEFCSFFGQNYGKVQKNTEIYRNIQKCIELYKDGHWIAWNVHGIFQNHASPLDNSSVTINLKLESSNEITGFWNLSCTFHANQCLSGVHPEDIDSCGTCLLSFKILHSHWTIRM